MCTNCDETFVQEKDVFEHSCVNEVNTNIYLTGASNQCKTCFDIFFDEKSLRSHRCSVQNNEQPDRFTNSEMNNECCKKLDCLPKK